MIPKIYWEWTKERINVQEYVDGISGVSLAAIDAAGIDRKRIAEIGARRQIISGCSLSWRVTRKASARFFSNGSRTSSGSMAANPWASWICPPWSGLVDSRPRPQAHPAPGSGHAAQSLRLPGRAFKKLDAAFDVMVAIQPTLHDAVVDRLSRVALGKRGLKILTQYVELFADLPKKTPED